jgi:hypothetical protein
MDYIPRNDTPCLVYVCRAKVSDLGGLKLCESGFSAESSRNKMNIETRKKEW